MAEVVGIRFKPCGKLYDFETSGMELNPGDIVVVESELGLSIGKVVCKSRASDLPQEYKKVMRLASEEDIRESKANAELEKEAFAFCRERVMARGLQMKLIRTEATLDRKRIIFYFIAEKRIDFRELVKDLAQKFRTRIEMRQVGVRDEAKMTGGLGLCGRQLCCTSFLVDFAPISIKMAKKQELVLNTGKLSGICGRLMCCLSYEYGGKASHVMEEPEDVITEETVPEEAPAAPEISVTAPPPEVAMPHTRTPEVPVPHTRTNVPVAQPRNRRSEHGPRHGRHGEKGQNRPRGREEGPAKTAGHEPPAGAPPQNLESPMESRTLGPEPPGPQISGPEATPPANKRKRKRRWRKRGRSGGQNGSSRNSGASEN